jgi:phospholipid-binding lipoprotein MlaA
VFEFNRVVDGLVIEPAARMYRMFFPQIVRQGIDNVIANLAAPAVFANDLLQGEFERAEMTLGRFMLNTTLGLGGIIDIGAHVGMPERHYEDFGQTLAVWGVGSGPYLVLPILGPSNPRDALGMGVDFLFDAFAFMAPTEAPLGRSATAGVSLREANIETLAELERTSLDFYASMRTLYRQMRAAEIRQRAPAPLDDIYNEDIFDDVFEDPAALENQGEEIP